MPEYYKIKDHKNLIKNADSKAVLTVDVQGLNKYREERNKLMQIARVTEDTARLNQEVAEIKDTLSEILDLLRNKA